MFCALAVARHLQDITGVSIKKLVRTLKPLRDVTVDIAGTELVATAPLGEDAASILEAITSAETTH
uniref:hypothetical protein n=1 Tax=Agrococcus sp. KRD186 TaxID=2729730 RepID=UPI0019D16DC0|nr:hypothetical protein [Agrococcus sp. KRD186]